MKKILLVAILIALAGLSVIGVRLWRNHVTRASEARAFQKAGELIREGRPIEALALFETHGSRPDSVLAWSEVEFRALVMQANLPRLTGIFQRDPDRILRDEEASLTVARAFLHLRQSESFEKARGTWRGKETRPDRWMLLDADRLLLSGDAAGATALLERQVLPGTNDVPRLLRLALIEARRNAPRSFQLLNEAVGLNSRAADARSFRGQVLETLGRPQEARVEYVAAVVAEPANPLWRDQLADYYRRQHAYDLALDTLRDGLHPPSLDVLWLKEEFWGRMIQPAEPASRTNHPPSGALAPLVQLVRSLPANRFFDTNAFATLPSLSRVARERHEVRWLRLAELLRQGDDTAAVALLGGPRPPGASWEPDLERALLRVLAWRTSPSTNRSLVPHGLTLPPPDRSPAELPTLFAQLETLAASEENAAAPRTNPPPELTRLLEGPHAFAAAFLAAGWREVGLQIAPVPTTPVAPTWLAYAYSQALRRNRGAQEALAFLQVQPSQPELELATGELLIASGQATNGLRRLEPLARQNTDAGYRAACLLALAALERLQPDLARDTVAAHPRLATNLTGSEILARVALTRGDTNEADRLYQALAPRSVEARTYLARQAYARHDWRRARELTLELLELLPDRLELRANLEAIALAEKAR